MNPRHVEIKEERQISHLSDHEVRIKSLYSGISAGTEMLVYRGDFPVGLPSDLNWSFPKAFGVDDLQPFGYPTKYGYSNVGCVLETSDNTSKIEPWRYSVHLASSRN
jgi:hypothetical protein